ncbi:MAG: right-handed parallel beta-helix repeat-containing protein [Spirosomataceae bacterium]
MKNQLIFFLFSCFFTTSQAQFSKLIKDFDKGVKEVKKTTDNASKSVKNATQGVEKFDKNSESQNDKKSSTIHDLPVGRDFYVALNGNGREATKNQPAKELAVVVPQVQAGDRIHIAAGIYLGATERGSDIFEVPVSIIGGYNSDFSSRDPWGKHRTILSGTNDYMKESTERIGVLTDKKFKEWNGTIIIDGLIIDNGPRNRYLHKKGLYILRKASEATNENPSPDTPGIKVRVGASTKVIIKNCLVTNTAPSQGAIDIQVGKNGTALIENNAIINNTGEGIMCKSLHQGADGIPQFILRNNTILFCWKKDEIATYGGNCIMMDVNTIVSAENNVLGFADFGGVNNVKQCKNLTLKDNLFVGHKKYDYKEYNTAMKLEDMDDYGQFLRNSSRNTSALIKVSINTQWAELYMSRKDINRGEIEANVKVSNGKWNQVRSILGLPLQGSSQGAAAEIWLHQLPLEDAIRAGLQKYDSKGCQKP